MKYIVSFANPLFLASVLTLGATSVLAGDEAFNLEPCINGGVSATGLYETQALEDSAFQGEKQHTYVEANDIGSGEDDVISAFGGHRDDFLR